ncbi:MAG TPA: glycosyltransferase 87 family protein [Chloroflexota bacterium]|nr:glycosyltransferase 87 family protein [Chloroflexota bacterium]
MAATTMKESPPVPSRRLRSYVLGNAFALYLGLIAAYVAGHLAGAGSGDLLNIRTTDFAQYYAAASMILHGHIGALYNLSATWHLQRQIAGPTHGVFAVIPYLYPPYFALALVPLALLPYGLAYLIWLACNCLMLSLAMFFLEGAADLGRRGTIAFRLLALASLPILLALGLGQVSLLLLVLCTLALVALRRGYDRAAGGLLAVASLKPAYLLPVLLVLLLTRRRRALEGYLAGVAVLIAAVLPFSGLGIYAGYLRLLRLDESWQGGANGGFWYHGVPISSATYAPQWNQSLAGFSQLLLPHSTAGPLYLVASLVVVLAVAWIAWKAPSITLPFGAAIAAGLLISPHTLMYDLAVALLPAAACLGWRRAAKPVLIPAALIAVELAVTIGYKLAFFVPVQLAVPALVLLVGLFALVTGRLAKRSAEAEGTRSLRACAQRGSDSPDLRSREPTRGKFQST